MFLEGTLTETLRKLEALHAGTTVDGEREAAKRAAEHIRERLAELRGRETEIAMLYRIEDRWNRKLFIALCRRYGLNNASAPKSRELLTFPPSIVSRAQKKTSRNLQRLPRPASTPWRTGASSPTNPSR